MRELVARVRAMLRRSASVADVTAPAQIERGGLHIDTTKHRVTRDGQEVALRPKEFDLLVALARSPGQVFSREQLLNSVWGLDHASDTRTVDTHVKNLREQLGDDADAPRWIETLRGVGYRFKERSEP